MEKKIIAVISVVVLLASVLAACAKKPTITGDNGMEYAVVTDKEGNTVVNDEGEVIVYVTDEHGKYVKNENGERETNALPFPKTVLNGQTLETPDYVLTMPEGWTSDEYGKFTKDGTNGAVYVKVVNFGKLQKDQTAESFVNDDAARNKALFEKAKDQIPDSLVEVRETTVTAAKAEAFNEVIEAKDKDGNFIYHAEGIYFMHKGEMFKIEYICDGSAYDAAININEIMNTALKMK